MSNGESSDSKGLGGSETEKYLADLNLDVQAKYKEGNYSEALELAKFAQSEMLDYFGKDHPVVASAWNNVAVMSKRLGHFNDAVEAYLQAVSTYRSAAGERHPQYVTTLSNLGLCFQAAALQTSEGKKQMGLERIPFLERAVETLQEVVDLRAKSEVSYSDSGGTVATVNKQSRMHLTLAQHYLAETRGNGGLTRAESRKKKEQAEGAAGDGLATPAVGGEEDKREGSAAALAALAATEDYANALEEKIGPDKAHSELATALNNQGFLLKSLGRFALAKVPYGTAVAMREELFGSAHPDAVAAKHNLAECLLADGDTNGASALQQEILDALGVIADDDDSDDPTGDGDGDKKKSAAADDSGDGYFSGRTGPELWDPTKTGV